MRFASLGSGSRGNATVIAAGTTVLLVDCGFSLREASRRLNRLGLDGDDLMAVLVTHEHGDHCEGVGTLARQFGLPVYLTAGTRRALGERLGPLPQVHVFSSHESFAIGDLEIAPFPVPHDALEPTQFVFSDGAVRLGVLTDVGCPTPHIEACLNGSEALILECNHERDLLVAGDYPPSVKERIASRMGHLDNGQAGDLIARLDCSRLQHLVAAHLSDRNNRPALARDALATALGCDADWIAVADQDEGLDWREL